MTTAAKFEPRKYKVYDRRHIESLPQLGQLGHGTKLAMQAVSAVLPFRVNAYVIDELIDWSNVPDDPIYQLTFPQPGMLEPDQLQRMMDLLQGGADADAVMGAAREIQGQLNPHPAGQMSLNVPHFRGEPLNGLQHKYRETVLFFPSQGQTCHAYCTYCFRWPQFVGMETLKFANREVQTLIEYLREHPEVSSVLFTGGDPLIMRTAVLRSYIEPLLNAGLDQLISIRIGSKAPGYWPYRFLTDPDADDLMRLFEQVTAAGKHLALMSHYSHPRELEPVVAQAAIKRIQATGAVVRCQAPLVRHINDSGDVWAELWRKQLILGAVPYYMFVERDTGPRNYFEVPLARALSIFQDAYRRVSGLGRTVRGPSMSATPGKIVVDGTACIGGEEVFVLQFIQARNPAWVGRPFFAKFDPNAAWLNQLEPAFGETKFFYETELEEMKSQLAHDDCKPPDPSRRELPMFAEAA